MRLKILVKNSTKILKPIIKSNGSVFALITLCIILSFVSKNFFSIANLFNILDLVSLVGITSIGICLVLLIGSIDLSVEGIIGLSGVIASYLVKNTINNNSIGYLAIPVCIVVGMIFGFANGIIVTKWRIPSFMATLGIGFITLGIGVLVTKGSPIVITDWGFRTIGIGKIFIFPMPFIIALIIIISMWIIIGNTIYGRHIFAIGGDEATARDLGIKVDRVKIATFVIAGGLYGLVGSMLTAKLGSGDVTAPIGYTFDAISACVLGGIAITGGVGNISKAVVGVLVLTVLRNGMILLGINPYIQQGLIGVILISTVFLTIDRKKIPIIK